MVDRLFREDTAVYVKYLHMSIDNARLEREFSRFGRVISARIVTDLGRSKGYGFVTFSTREAANAAIQKMNGFKLEGKRLYVSLADRQKPPMEMGQFFPAGSARGYYDPNLEPSGSTVQQLPLFRRSPPPSLPEPPTLSNIERIERQLAEHRIENQPRVDTSQQRIRGQINLRQRLPIPNVVYPPEDPFPQSTYQNQRQLQAPRSETVTLEQLHQLLEQQTELVSPEDSLLSPFAFPPLPHVASPPAPQVTPSQEPAIPRIIFPQPGNQNRFVPGSQPLRYGHLLFPPRTPTPPPPPPPHGQFAAPPYFTSPYEGPSRMYFMGPSRNNPWNMPLPQTPAAPRNTASTLTSEMPVNRVRPTPPAQVRPPSSTITSFPPIRPSTSVWPRTPSPTPTPPPMRQLVAVRPSTYAQACGSTYPQVASATATATSTYAQVCASNSHSVTQRPPESNPIQKMQRILQNHVLTEEQLNAVPYYRRKSLIKEYLYPRVQSMFPYLARRIISGLLNLPNDELLHMLHHEPCFKKRVNEAAVSFRQQQIRRAAIITATATEARR